MAVVAPLRGAALRPPYPPSEPTAHGLLDVGDGHRVHWEEHGAPDGLPALALHGGPGSGCSPWFARLFDPARHRIVLLDQRGCGRSVPHAGETLAALEASTTHHLVADLERLREARGIGAWHVALGLSWGSTLALAYAQRHPGAVRGLVLGSVATTTRREIDWIVRGVGARFPQAWARFRDGVPPAERDGDLVAAYARLLRDPDPAVAARAARDWCAWEDAHVRTAPEDPPDPRYADPRFRLGFARLVTHVWSHAAWLAEDELLRGMPRLAGIPGVLVHGLRDVSGPADVPRALHRAWPGSELVELADAGHRAGAAATVDALVRATDRLAG